MERLGTKTIKYCLTAVAAAIKPRIGATLTNLAKRSTYASSLRSQLHRVIDSVALFAAGPPAVSTTAVRSSPVAICPPKCEISLKLDFPAVY